MMCFIFLVGCGPAIVRPNFPEAPAILLEESPDLQTVKPDSDLNLEPIKLSDIMKTVTINYGTYYTEREKVRGWQEWYAKQKKIYEDLDK